MSTHAQQSAREGLRRGSVRGLAVSAGGQGLRLLIAAGQIVVLSRLLPPDTWGVFQMTWAVLALIYNSRDLGISAAVIQRQEASQGFLNAAFWLSGLSGVVLALLVLVLAYPLSLVYREPGVVAVALKFAPMFVLAGISQHFQAVMRREMDFVRLNILLTIAQVVGTGGAVALAFGGYGINALIFMLLGQEIVLFLLSPLFCKWRPGRPSLEGESANLVRFGGDLSLFRMLQNLAAGMDTIALGLFTSTGVVGLYSRAMALFATPRRQILIPFTQVVPTLLSRLQDDAGEFSRTACRLFNAVAYVWFPFLALMAAVPGAALEVVVGPQWSDAAGLLPVLALGELTRLHMLLLNVAEIQLGRTRSLRQFGFVSAPIIILALVGGAAFGMRTMVWCYAGAQLLVFALRLVEVNRHTPLKLGAVLGSLSGPFVLGLLLAGSLRLGDVAAQGHSAWVRLPVALGVGVLGAAVYFAIWKPGRDDALALLRTARLLRGVR